MQYSIISEGAAPRQWRSPRRGARRVGEPTPLQLNIKLMICNYTPAPHIPEVFCDKFTFRHLNLRFFSSNFFLKKTTTHFVQIIIWDQKLVLTIKTLLTLFNGDRIVVNHQGFQALKSTSGFDIGRARFHIKFSIISKKLVNQSAQSPPILGFELGTSQGVQPELLLGETAGYA